MVIIPVIIALSGFIIRFLCITRIGNNFWKICDNGIVTDGVYRYIRHPMYLGSLIMGFGMFWFMLGVKASLCLTYLLLNFVLDRIDREENLMLHIYGKQYEDYMNRTWRLIPRIF
jgi:protein-S-isoprenylcysteine O-methyltransferase Ste14